MATPELGREIATTGNGRDITRGWVGSLLRTSDRLLQRRGGSLELYEQVASDAQVQATFAQRRLALTSREWSVEPGDTRRQSKAAADWLREQLQHVGWDRVTDRMLWGTFYGYAVAELVYARDGQYVGLDAIKVRNRRRFAFDDQHQLRLLTPSHLAEGEPAEPPYFWWLATGADHDDEPYGLGLAHWLYWPVLFKREGMRFWLTFLEKFGAPTAVGKYGPNATQDERRKLLEATEAIQSDAGVILPEGMVIELLEAARSGSVDYTALQSAMDATIAKVVLGQTMTSEDGASLSQAKVHMEVRGDLVKADADLISESFNRGPVAWLMALNFPAAALPKVWRQMEEPEDLLARSERDTKVRGLGFKPTAAYIQETYGEGWEADAARPVENDPVEAARPGEVDPAAAFASGNASDDDPSTVNQLATTLARAAAPGWEAVLDHVQQLVDNAKDMSSLRTALIEAYADLPQEALGEAMTMALTVAQLAGRFDLTNESTGG